MIEADQIIRTRRGYPDLEIREGDWLFVNRGGLTQTGKPVIVADEDGGFTVRAHEGGRVEGVVTWLYRSFP